MNEKTQLQGAQHYNMRGELLYCPRCDVYPSLHEHVGQRSCLCTTAIVSLPFPDHWKWVEPGEGS